MVKKRGEVWYARVDTKDANGKRLQKWIRLPDAKNEREAKRAEARLKTQAEDGLLVEPTRITVGQFLEQWLVGVKPTVSARSFITYTGLVSGQLIPQLGSIPLTKLTASHIRAAYTRMLETGRKDGKGGLQPITVNKAHRLLKQALQQAVNDGRLVKNPAATVKPPRVQWEEQAALDEKDTIRLLEAAKAPRRGQALYIPILLAVYTGMRLGEVRAALAGREC
jgi:integrase